MEVQRGCFALWLLVFLDSWDANERTPLYFFLLYSPWKTDAGGGSFFVFEYFYDFCACYVHGTGIRVVNKLVLTFLVVESYGDIPGGD